MDILNGAKYFVEDESQNYLVFQPAFKHSQTFTHTDKILVWKSKGLSEKSFKTPVTPDKSFALKLVFNYKGRMRAKFKGNC